MVKKRSKRFLKKIAKRIDKFSLLGICHHKNGDIEIRPAGTNERLRVPQKHLDYLIAILEANKR